MQTTTGAILLVIGVVALFAAIVGGGVKIREIEVGSLPSRWRQGFLAIFGIVVAITGLILVMIPPGSDSAAPAPQNAESSNPTDDVNTVETTSGTNTADQNDTDANATDATGTAATDSSSGEEAAQ